MRSVLIKINSLTSKRRTAARVTVEDEGEEEEKSECAFRHFMVIESRELHSHARTRIARGERRGGKKGRKKN